MKFSKFDLAEEIQFNLTEMKFFRTTDIQYRAIPPILNGEDILAVAQTGTGKTAAFAIPLVHLIHSRKVNKKNVGLKCIVLVPTRELAKQIGKVFNQVSKKTNVKCFAIYGGVEQDPQIAQLTSGVDVLIATPGRMFDLIAQGHLNPRTVDHLVLDEADQMLDLGFIEDIQSIKRRLKNHHQTLFFSATINPAIKKLAYSQIRSSALRIQVSPKNLVSKNIAHSVSLVPMDSKRHLLVHFLTSNPESRTIVFVRTKVRAERVDAHLKKNGIEATKLHGDMEQAERESSLSRFRDNQCNVMIATDVSARGIDVPGVSHVINYDLPDDPQNYVHRIGRTGRAFAKGDAISFYAPEEKEKLKKIEEFLQTEIQVLKVDSHYFEEQKPKVNLENQSMADLLAEAEAEFR
tara:strand:+ start:6160 stop:7374 length:1215 start_codon:yes stop_codon:yes gene_type:complete